MSGFKDVVGHSEIIQYIQNAVTEDKVSHAYILNGEKGSGKKMLAGLFAREFDTLKTQKVLQSLEIGLFFCQIFIFII